MAVYTEVPDDDLARFIAEYDAGTLLSCKGIAEGVENSNFLLHTSGGYFILTLYEKRVNPADLPFFLGLMQHLAARGISCPLPVQRRDGALLGRLCDRPAAMVTFLDGMSVKKPAAAQCGMVGEGLARMHGAAEGFALGRANALSLDGWRGLVEGLGEKANKFYLGLASVLNKELDELAAQWPQDLPRGIIHADLFPDNVFFLQNGLSGFIDFYFACTDMLAYDLAICLNAWCFEPDGAYNATKGRALIAGYHRVRPLSAEEQAALPLLARGAALRFLLTRLVDWFSVPEGALVRPKDPTEYLRKLRFHQSVADISAYGWSA